MRIGRVASSVLVALAFVAVAAVVPAQAGTSPGTTLTVTPSTNLSSPTSVQISGVGFGANATVFLTQCKTNFEQFLDNCAELGAPVTADANGNFSVERAVTLTYFAPGVPPIPVSCLPHNDCFVDAFSDQGKTDDHPISFATGGAPSAQLADFDGDEDTDVSIYRPGGLWFVEGGITSWGTAGDIAVPGDYNGDLETDVAVFRPSTGQWFVNGGLSATFGTTGDIPLPGDYDNDGDDDIAVFRPSSGIWFFVDPPAGEDATIIPWGTAGDIPVPADYDGNGTIDIAVFRPSNGVWFIRNGPTVAWGTSGDIPVPADYDGDGDADIAVFRPSIGVWFVQGGQTVAWGTEGDIPVPGDYSPAGGDGAADIAVFRPSTGTWFIQGADAVNFGGAGDEPLAMLAWVRRIFFPPTG